MAHLTANGFRLVVASNQANIGRGLISTAALDDIHARMLTAVNAAGGRIEAIYVCEHLPEDGCECRKPRPGLLLRAAADLDFDIARSVVVGDARSDIEAAAAAGSRSLLVLTGVEGALPPARRASADMVAPDLAGAAQALVRATRATAS
jgi:D-glycero-D-manno-heptose 1,7-bisphosphate phosphatase